jgi:hypothetical protein
LPQNQHFKLDGQQAGYQTICKGLGLACLRTGLGLQVGPKWYFFFEVWAKVVLN